MDQHQTLVKIKRGAINKESHTVWDVLNPTLKGSAAVYCCKIASCSHNGAVGVCLPTAISNRQKGSCCHQTRPPGFSSGSFLRLWDYRIHQLPFNMEPLCNLMLRNDNKWCWLKSVWAELILFSATLQWHTSWNATRIKGIQGCN